MQKFQVFIIHTYSYAYLFIYFVTDFVISQPQLFAYKFLFPGKETALNNNCGRTCNFEIRKTGTRC